MNPESYPTPTAHYRDGGDAVRSTLGKSGAFPSSPVPQSEVDRELSAQSEAVEILVSQLSSLAARLDPVLHPAPDAGAGKSANPCSSIVGSRINGNTDRIHYAIGVIVTLRDGLAI